jgi:hypothetical protein
MNWIAKIHVYSVVDVAVCFRIYRSLLQYETNEPVSLSGLRHWFLTLDEQEVIVTWIPIARQRLGKHIPAETNDCNNRTSIARQRIIKHVCLTIEAVFSVWSVQSGYKEMFRNIEQYSSRVSSRQPAGI